MGSVLTNKYAEGYPCNRYYGGCEVVDEIEALAIQRAKDLFGAEHANVQPHSGSTANQAIYWAALEPGDHVLAMSLAHGGHLTHGHAINFSGRGYTFFHYGVSKETGLIDMDQVRAKALEHKPKIIVLGASARAATHVLLASKTCAALQGRDFVEDPSRYKLIIHCGSCMLNRREVLSRIFLCQRAGVPITNYGMAIAYSLGIFERALTRPGWTRPSSPACRAVRWSTSSPARRSASCWRGPRSSGPSSASRWRTRRCWPTRCWRGA